MVDWYLDKQGTPIIKHVALGDFDIALKLKGGRPLSGPHPIGNILWRSPEGQTGKGVAKPSDVYSLALVLYALGGAPLLIPAEEDLENLAKTNNGLLLEILARHFNYFGPLAVELLDHVNDIDQSKLLKLASEVSDQIVKEDPGWRIEQWPEDIIPHIDIVGRNLISRMSKLDPAARATMDEVLEHSCNTTAKCIVFETRRAVGAELITGEIVRAEKGVVLCCGVLRSPQVFMLQLIDSPGVGKNFSDHAAVTQFYRINEAEKGLCAPSPTSTTILTSKASQPTTSSRTTNDVLSHPHVVPPRSHYEILPMYPPTEVPLTDLNISLDGSIISISLINLLATSRGTVTLASTGPAIDPNYCATEVARVILRTAMLQDVFPHYNQLCTVLWHEYTQRIILTPK
ncbi:MAG: hypothetical protein Q9185_002629 [Variospora sp. 1 TL-2023]